MKVVIVGAGPAGLFTAYELSKNGDIDITVLDKGKDIYKRQCPIREGKVKECVHCKPCNITCGFGGSGTYSDCKLSLTPYGVGGNIVDYIGNDYAEQCVEKVDKIFSFFDLEAENREVIGDYKNVYIIDKLNSAGLDFTYCPTKHLGTDGTFGVMKNMYEYLNRRPNVTFYFEEEVTDLISKENSWLLFTRNCNEYFCNKVIFAPGRSGNSWLSEILADYGVETVSNKFDIGFRVELPKDIVKELTDNLYDMKISQTVDGIKTRTFCTNPGGYVSEEHYDEGYVLANGHSYADKKSDNTNFAVLVSLPISTREGKDIIKSFYTAFGDKLVLNTYTQLFNHDNDELVTKPTLDIENRKDMMYYLPSIFLSHVYNFLNKLDKAYPGVCSKSTNIYGLEAKFYSDTIDVKNNFETKQLEGVYCIGDGSGITRGIVQSACCGLVVAKDIIDRAKDGANNE